MVDEAKKLIARLTFVINPPSISFPIGWPSGLLNASPTTSWASRGSLWRWCELNKPRAFYIKSNGNLYNFNICAYIGQRNKYILSDLSPFGMYSDVVKALNANMFEKTEWNDIIYSGRIGVLGNARDAKFDRGFRDQRSNNNY